jgi:hypothetical protein
MEISAFNFSFDGNGKHCILSSVWSYILNIVTDFYGVFSIAILYTIKRMARSYQADNLWEFEHV